MENSYGFLAILPPLIAIIVAIRTKQVYLALLMGIFFGFLIIDSWNPWQSLLSTIESMVNVFKSPGNTRTIMFSALVGALILLVQKSGGVDGFVIFMDKVLDRIEHKSLKTKQKLVQILAWLTGIIVFVETSISSLTVGTIFRPVFDKLKIPREKLAYIADSSSAPTSILIPLNAWGVFIMGLLIAQDFTQPINVLLKSMMYNFYPIFALLLVPFLILTGIDFGPMLKAEQRTKATGKLMNDNAKPMISKELTEAKPSLGTKLHSYNMIIPIATMVLMMPVMLSITGKLKGSTLVHALHKDDNFFNRFIYSMINGDGSKSVLVAVIVAILVAAIMYRAQNIFKTNELVDLILKGISELLPLALLMLLAFSISSVAKQLHIGEYIAEVTKSWLSPGLLPFLLFIISAFIAFSTGTSWGTFGIMIPIAVPLAQSMGADVYMTIAAVLGGGVFGDHSSPISDTTIISSMASASDHIDHVKTQLPYALVAGGLTALFYLILGLTT